MDTLRVLHIATKSTHFSPKEKELSLFGQVAIDAKSVLTFEMCPLVAELKLKVSEN